MRSWEFFHVHKLMGTQVFQGNIWSRVWTLRVALKNHCHLFFPLNVRTNAFHTHRESKMEQRIDSVRESVCLLGSLAGAQWVVPTEIWLALPVKISYHHYWWWLMKSAAAHTADSPSQRCHLSGCLLLLLRHYREDSWTCEAFSFFWEAVFHYGENRHIALLLRLNMFSKYLQNRTFADRANFNMCTKMFAPLKML